VLHAVRHIYYVEPGGLTRGVPTADAAAPLASLLTPSDPPPVWPDPLGETRGTAIKPLRESVPRAAKRDPELHALLALAAALRIGQARARSLAALADGREELADEVRSAEAGVRGFIAEAFRTLLEDPAFVEARPAHLMPDAASQARGAPPLAAPEIASSASPSSPCSNPSVVPHAPPRRWCDDRLHPVRPPACASPSTGADTHAVLSMDHRRPSSEVISRAGIGLPK